MAARDRGARSLKAIQEGWDAAKAGKPITACPFKASTSGWSLAPFWKMGHNRFQWGLNVKGEKVHAES